MDAQRVAELQVVLEGVPLPAAKEELLEYARRQEERAAAELAALPDRDYRSLDEVGEALLPVQPSHDKPAEPPREESGAPPGGDAYLDPDPDSGAVRD